MSNSALKSPRESVAHIAAFFNSVRDLSIQDRYVSQPVFLSVREDICFGDQWLSLGEIALKPGLNENDAGEFTPVENAIRHGFYEWKMQSYEALENECLRNMGVEIGERQNDGKAKDITRRALHSIVDVAMRLGLLFPQFDADVVTAMPFNRPTTVIADTNAVGKGGVDFLIRFLYPVARLKVPAIVAMEILNQSDRFFSQRRRALINEPKSKQKPSILLDHVVSQAGQRAMLRFELHSDIEVERTPLFSDPLRNAFTHDRDTDWPELNLSVPIKSYCDRLILETARQHLTSVTPGHSVMLMTGDEGLARMTLAEGMQPLFFHAGRTREQYGQVLTGTPFHPFTGEVFSVPLQCLLWELAVTFGNVRLANGDGSIFFEVRAIDQNLNWQPFHAKDDLLRVSWRGFNQNPPDAINEQFSITHAESVDKAEGGKARRGGTTEKKTPFGKTPKKSTKPRPKHEPVNLFTVYRFDLKVLIDFIAVLLIKGTVPATCEGTPLQERNLKIKQIRRYLGFLTKGQFIVEAEGLIRATDSLQQLWDALMARDLPSISQRFRAVPSLNHFLERLENERRIVIDTKAPESERPSPAYMQIAELCGHALLIPQDAIYGTFHNPLISEFVDLAFEAYQKNRKGEDYVLTGLWLETLARDYGIHPIKARERLAEAQAAGLLERYTQGSTPDTRFEKHTLTVLQVQGGKPAMTKACLYHGDFIIPGKASVSIRLERK